MTKLKVIDVKRRTGLGRKFAVTVDSRGREEPLKPAYKSFKRVSLGSGPSILRRLAIFGYAADIADADGIGVVAKTMCPRLLDRPTGLDRPVEQDEEMITDTVETSLTMPAVDISDIVRPPLGRSRTMNNNLRNFSHMTLMLIQMQN